MLTGGVLASGLLSRWDSTFQIDPQNQILFARYLNASQPELGRLLYVLDLYRDKGYQVLYNGNSYGIAKAVGKTRESLYANYRGEKAEDWVKAHLYVSPEDGKVILMEFPDGSKRPLKDVFLRELRRLPRK
jgi:hypothetical protein